MIDSYVWQGRSLLVQVQQLRNRSGGSKSNPLKDIVGEIGGGVGEYFLESSFGRKLGKKITKGIVAESEKQQISQNEQSLQSSFSVLLDNIRSFLSSVSIIYAPT